MEQIQIRRAEWTDREQIFAFYRRSYPDWENRIPDRWDWQVLNNPFRPEGPPPVWLAVNSDNEVMGQTMAVMEPMHLEGAETLAGWSVDAFIAEPLRGQGIGRKLKDAMQRDLDLVMSISMADAVRHINITQGALALPELKTYLLQTDPQHITRAMAGAVGKTAGAMIQKLHPGALLSGWINAQTRRRRQRMIRLANEQLEFESVIDFPQEVDLLWQAAAPRFTGAVVRSAQYLNWKYGAQPLVDYDCFLIRKSEHLIGYLVLRRGSQRGTVVDLLVDPADPHLIFQVLDFAVNFFQQHDVLEVRGGSSCPIYQKCLRQCGWGRPINQRTPLLHIKDHPEPNRLPGGSWLFGLGDHDQQQ